MKIKISNSVSGLTVLTVTLLTVLTVILPACRQESDDVMNYAYQDEMAFSAADSSYAAEFDVLWSGMNANYALWDYEYEQGLDWDKVYEEFRPKFAALDASKTAVPDSVLKALLDSVITPLHDGHMTIQVKNRATGNYVSSAPGVWRLVHERMDEYNTAANRNMLFSFYRDAGEFKEYMTANSYTMQTLAMKAYAYLKTTIDRLDSIPEADRTQEQNDTLNLYTKVNSELTIAFSNLLKGEQKKAIELYNILAYRYEYLHIPSLEPVEPVINEYGLEIVYALTKDNIAYLYFDGFKLSAYLQPEFIEYFFGSCSDGTKALIQEVGNVWRTWFNAIQEHKKAGDLKGVIIDVRSNGGGFLHDSKFVLGALLPAGGFTDCNARFKRGPGRFDYSPVLPQVMPTMDEEHVTVTEPVVVLCNCGSVSMAEHTSYGAKVMQNGTLIGTRTYGGFSALSDAPSYTNNYSGYVGVMNETPVFCYIPQEVAYTLDGKVVEGHGIDPDIVVELDAAALNGGNGRDTQLDRALQFIRTGN